MKFSHCECAGSQCSFDIFDDHKPLSTTKGWNSLESPWVDSDCVTFNQMASSNAQQYLLVRTLTCVVSCGHPVQRLPGCYTLFTTVSCALSACAPFILPGDGRHRSACTVLGSKASTTLSDSFRDASNHTVMERLGHGKECAQT